MTGLAASTTYHFRIRSTDVQGNLATSSDQTLLTNWIATDTFSNAALLDEDFANSRYWYSGQNYASEIALNTALGATTTGITRTIGPYVFGPNILTNWTFDSDVSGWAGTGTSNVSWSSNNGGSLLLFVNGNSAPTAYQLLTVQANRAYTVSGQAWQDNGTGFPSLQASVNYNMQNAAGTSPTTASLTPVSTAGYFSAEGTAIYIGLHTSGNGASGNYRFDNITVKESVPFQGMVSGKVGVKISATAPATVGATMVLWQAGGNERDRVRLELHTDFYLHYIVTWQNGADSLNPATDLDLGVLLPSTSFSVEAQAGIDTFSASLNGGTRIYAPVGQMPGLAQMWIGRSFTGETWTGTIQRVSVFPKAYAQHRTWCFMVIVKLQTLVEVILDLTP